MKARSHGDLAGARLRRLEHRVPACGPGGGWMAGDTRGCGRRSRRRQRVRVDRSGSRRHRRALGRRASLAVARCKASDFRRYARRRSPGTALCRGLAGGRRRSRRRSPRRSRRRSVPGASRRGTSRGCRALRGRFAAALLPLGVPQLLVHGGRDDIVPPQQSRGYAAAARAAGDEVELAELPGADHFDVIESGHPAWIEVVDWLQRRLNA